MNKINKEIQDDIAGMQSNYKQRKSDRFTISEEKIIVDIIKEQMLSSIKEENDFKLNYINKKENKSAMEVKSIKH